MGSKFHSSFTEKHFTPLRYFWELNFPPTSQICPFLFLSSFRKQVSNFHYIYYLFLGTKFPSTSWTTWPGIEFSSHNKSYKHYKKRPFNCNLKIMVWVKHTDHSTCSLWSSQPKKKKIVDLRSKLDVFISIASLVFF